MTRKLRMGYLTVCSLEMESLLGKLCVVGERKYDLALTHDEDLWWSGLTGDARDVL